MSTDFDLPAYLARIGLKEPPPANLDGLAEVQRAHRLAIPFENLDVILGRGISLDPDAVFDKLVQRRRGGYCFEQSQLFLRALHALGFEARPLLARVWLGASEPPPKTHTLNLVNLNGELWIADAAFGGSYTPPLPLADGAEATTSDGASHRLRRDPDHEWMLERHGDAAFTDGRGADHEGWLPQYSFTLEPVFAADLALANHWTSTAPGTLFTTMRMANIVLPNGFASLINRQYRRRNADQANSGEIDSARVYRMRLSLMFGIDLTVEEVEALGLFDAIPSPQGGEG